MILKLTSRLDIINQNFICSSSLYSSSKKAVILPLVTSPNARMDNPAIPQSNMVTTLILIQNALWNPLGSFMADSTGRMMQIPSKLYKIPHNAMGALTGLKVGNSDQSGRDSHSLAPMTPKLEKPAMISTVPANMTGAKLLRDGKKLKAIMAGMVAEMTAPWLFNMSTSKNCNTAYRFSPTKLIKTVQMANCCVQMHTAMYF
mmetsp:Transcript_23117/g.42895  ORF Transcript_23117/g.42895 Transcript_23117/m.42895 type:complete len:202 (+) Transcript_23117:889-1494(+)